jgi:hypothetical protein
MKKKNRKIHIVLAVIIAAVIVAGLSAFSQGEKGGDTPSLGISFGSKGGAASGGGAFIDPSGFSFEMPDGYVARSLPDDAGKAIVVEKEGETGKGFQIAVSYYDEPASGFTIARIRKDLPDLVMKNAKEISVAGGQGVSFDSDSGLEIWFVVAESLYQISASEGGRDAAQRAIDTFKAE